LPSAAEGGGGEVERKKYRKKTACAKESRVLVGFIKKRPSRPGYQGGGVRQDWSVKVSSPRGAPHVRYPAKKKILPIWRAEEEIEAKGREPVLRSEGGNVPWEEKSVLTGE